MWRCPRVTWQKVERRQGRWIRWWYQSRSNTWWLLCCGWCCWWGWWGLECCFPHHQVSRGDPLCFPDWSRLILVQLGWSRCNGLMEMLPGRLFISPEGQNIHYKEECGRQKSRLVLELRHQTYNGFHGHLLGETEFPGIATKTTHADQKDTVLKCLAFILASFLPVQ